MSKFFEALSRDVAGPVPAGVAIPPLVDVDGTKWRPIVAREKNGAADKNSPDVLPRSAVAALTLARDHQIGRIVETIGAVAAAEGGIRLAVAECTPGDGSAAVAEALVLDLTQRLGLRTLLVDGGPRQSSPLQAFADSDDERNEPDTDQALAVRRTKWARFETVTVRPAASQLEPEKFRSRLNECMQDFPASIIDLGAVRSDPRMLPLFRKSDSVLIVARAGVTQRTDLKATMNLFSNLHGEVAGVMLHGYISAVPPWLRRLLERKVH